MAKGQQRSNRETKKPKKTVAKATPGSSPSVAFGKGTKDAPKKR